jgi:hypothetical protein
MVDPSYIESSRWQGENHLGTTPQALLVTIRGYVDNGNVALAALASEGNRLIKMKAWIKTKAWRQHCCMCALRHLRLAQHWLRCLLLCFSSPRHGGGTVACSSACLRCCAVALLVLQRSIDQSVPISAHPSINRSSGAGCCSHFGGRSRYLDRAEGMAASWQTPPSWLSMFKAVAVVVPCWLVDRRC